MEKIFSDSLHFDNLILKVMLKFSRRQVSLGGIRLKIKELNLSINLEGIEMKYSYLMESRKYNNETVYGIVVKKESIKNKVVVSTIEDRVDIISKKKEVVQKLLDLLYRNQVSPIHLIDVIGETVDNCVLEFN